MEGVVEGCPDDRQKYLYSKLHMRFLTSKLAIYADGGLLDYISTKNIISVRKVRDSPPKMNQ